MKNPDIKNSFSIQNKSISSKSYRKSNSDSDNLSDHPVSQQFYIPSNNQMQWLNDIDTNNNTKECGIISKDANHSLTNLINRLAYSNIPMQPKDFFSKKALTITSLRPIRTLTKDKEVHLKQWAESLYRIEDKTYFGRLHRKRNYINYAIIALSLLSIILCLIDTELYISYSQEYLGRINDAYAKEKNLTEITIDDYLHIQQRSLSDTENIIRSANVISSLSLGIIIIVYYDMLLKILVNDNKMSKYDTLTSSGLLIKMLIDLFIGIFCYPPNLHIVYQLSEGDSDNIINLNCVFNALSFIKLRFVFKIFYYFHRWNKKVSQAICKSYHVKHDLIFSLKCELKHRPCSTLIFCIGIALCLLGGLTRSFEFTALNKKTGLLGKKNINDLRILLNNFWLMAITIMGVGYGDYAPRTFIGRIVVFIASVFGVLVMCLCIVSVSFYADLNREENKAYVKLNRLFNSDNKQNKASNILKLLLKLRRLYKINEGKKQCSRSINESFALFALLITHIKLMCNDYIVANCYALPITDILESMNHKITENIQDFNDIVEQLDNLEMDIHFIQENHNNSLITLGKVDLMQRDVMKYLFEQFNRLYVRKERLKKQRQFDFAQKHKWKILNCFNTIGNLERDDRRASINGKNNKSIKHVKTYKTSKNIRINEKKNEEMVLPRLIGSDNILDTMIH